MICDFRVMPRSSGKTTLAIQAAEANANSLIIATGFRFARDITCRCSCKCISMYDLIPRLPKETVLIFDELYRMPPFMLQWILDHKDRYDIYIYTGQYERSQEQIAFEATLRSEQPELFI